MLRLWLLFSQAATICVAALFVVSTFRPEWLPQRAALSNAPPVTVVQQVATQPQVAGGTRLDSYNEAVKRAAPSVVSVFTAKEVRQAPFNDPLFRRFFRHRAGHRLGFRRDRQRDRLHPDEQPRSRSR
jgi:S1-C subfamily serine protease